MERKKWQMPEGGDRGFVTHIVADVPVLLHLAAETCADILTAEGHKDGARMMNLEE